MPEASRMDDATVHVWKVSERSLNMLDTDASNATTPTATVIVPALIPRGCAGVSREVERRNGQASRISRTILAATCWAKTKHPWQ